MFFSFAYLALRALLGLLVRSRRGPDIKDIEVMVLRHELDRGAGSRLGSIVVAPRRGAA